MRVPKDLSLAFGAEFEEKIARFAFERGMIPEAQALHNVRFLSRSLVPHIKKLSGLFNRRKDEPTEEAPSKEKGPRGRKADKRADQAAALDPYWKESSNPANFRLAYFLYFMPSNLYRVASVWAELSRLGYRWSAGPQLRAIEFGAGPAAGATGIAAGEHHASTGIPREGNWALIEQDKAMLQLGSDWAKSYFADQGFEQWETRTFHRKIEMKRGLLPRSAPKFNLWVMSFFLNELEESPAQVAEELLDAWERHLDEEGIVLMIEPALKLQSRRLLEIRSELIALARKRGADWMKILLPCMGHQACGALAAAEDWCHEEVSWWRPPYFKRLDQMAELDRKTLPFSYLVVTRSSRRIEEILPALRGTEGGKRVRLVSPAHHEGRDLEFFVCGDTGKQRARYRPEENQEIDRGDILAEPEIRGDSHAARIDKLSGIK